MLKSSVIDSTAVDRLLGPLSKLGIKPNQWTLFSLPLAFAGFVALYFGHLIEGLVFFLLSGAVDMVDGAVARFTGQVTHTGAFIDGILDRYVEMLLIMGLMFYLGPGEFMGIAIQVWIFILLFGAIMTSFVRAYADHRHLIRNESLQKKMGGLLERAERLILLYAGMAIGYLDVKWLMAAIAITAILSNATALQRIVFAVKNAES